MLGRRSLLGLALLLIALVASLDVVPQAARLGATVGAVVCVALPLLVLDLWVLFGVGKAGVLAALNTSAQGIRAKAEPYPSGTTLLKPPGRVRVRGLPLLPVFVAFSLEKGAKKHDLLKVVFRKSIGNLKW